MTHRELSLVHCCFSLYISDISTDIDSEIRLFADDCISNRQSTCKNKKYRGQIETTERYTSILTLGKEFGYEISTCEMHHGENDKKTDKKIYASYTLEGTVLESVKGIKYLGVSITNDLRWNTLALKLIGLLVY